MERAITGFSRDKLADWFATLECGHRQHVRHKPPFFNRLWVESEEGRAALLGQPLNCVRCDRLELPDGFVVYKHTPEFSEQTLPAGLRRDHAIKQGSWGLLHVLEGSLTLHIHGAEHQANADETLAIPPVALHYVRPTQTPLRCRIGFLRPAVGSGDALV